MDEFELKISKWVKCPKVREHQGATVVHLVRKKSGNPVATWFFCLVCSKRDFSLPETVNEAYERWQKRLKKMPRNPLPYKYSGKIRVIGGYELAEDRVVCRKCKNLATIARLRPIGGGKPFYTWFLCDHCSPPDFHLPADAQEAYERWQEIKSKNHGGEVKSTFTPS